MQQRNTVANYIRSIMGKQMAQKFLISVFILQLQLLGTHQIPLPTTGINTAIDGDKVKHIESSLHNISGFRLKHETSTFSVDNSFQLDTDESWQRLREQIIIAKRTQHRIFVHDPEDIVFMLTALILLCFHLFVMDMFIRLTRTHFQTNSRYQYLSTVHLFLAFLVCTVYFLLILLHYRDGQYCG